MTNKNKIKNNSNILGDKMVSILQNLNNSSTQTEETFDAKFQAYLNGLLDIGKVKSTNSGNGVRRTIAESTKEMLALPTMEEATDGLWVSDFLGDDGIVRHYLFIMRSADIASAINALVKAGMPNPKELESQLDNLAELFG